MLDAIRRNSQSWIVKVGFGIIILVFVFWGLGSVQGLNSTINLATVNGEVISTIDFENTFQKMQEAVRARNPQITAEQMRQMQLPQQAMTELIVQTLLDEEIARLGMSVPPQVLRETIVKMPQFLDADGNFDAVNYKRFVNAQFQGAANFEAIMREELLKAKLRQEVTLTAKPYAAEVAASIDYDFENRDVEYIFFPASEAVDKVEEPASDTVKAYYESNQNIFTLPARSDIEYVEVSALALGNPESISTEDVSAYYAKNKEAKYSIPAQAKARHIMLTLEDNASAEDVQKATDTLKGIEQQLKDGADFAKLAEEYSQDTNSAKLGGDLGLVSKGQMVPVFEQALFALKDGELSEIIRSEYGLHLIKMEENKPASIKAQDEVEQEIREVLAKEAGLIKIREVLDTLIEANVLGNDVAKVAAVHNLKVQTTGLQSPLELEKTLNITPEQSKQLIALGKGVPLDTAMQTTKDSYIIAKISQKDDAKVRPFEEVKEEIVTSLKEKDALAKALENAATTLKTYADKTPEDVDIKEILKVKRGSQLEVFGTQAELGAALFTADIGKWLPAAYTVSIDGKPGAVLARVKAVHKGDENDWKPFETLYISANSRQRSMEMFKLFVDLLRKNADIKILNPAYLESANNR